MSASRSGKYRRGRGLGILAVRSRVLRYEKLNQGLEALGLFQNILCTIASTLERLAAVRCR